MKKTDKILKKIKTQVPEAPGVYLFYDKNRTVIYVGKSVCLKKRTLSYLRSSTAMEERIRRMVFHMDDLFVIKTKSELEALLLEDELIKKHLPAYNIRQKEFENYKYLELTADPYPCLKILDFAQDFQKKEVYGPFRDIYFAEDIKHLACKHLLLRSCTEKEPKNRCPNHGINACSGPCVSKASAKEYQSIVKGVRRFLKGYGAPLLKILDLKLKSRAKALDYESAQKIKETMETVKRFCDRQKFINKFISRDSKILDQTGFAFENRIKGDEDPRYLLDRANIVYSYKKCQVDFL